MGPASWWARRRRFVDAAGWRRCRFSGPTASELSPDDVIGRDIAGIEDARGNDRNPEGAETPAFRHGGSGRRPLFGRRLERDPPRPLAVEGAARNKISNIPKS